MAFATNFDDRFGSQSPGVKNSAANFGRGPLGACRGDVSGAWTMTALALDAGDGSREIRSFAALLHVRSVAVETTKGELWRLQLANGSFGARRSFGRLAGRQTRATQFCIVRQAVLEILASNAPNQSVADCSRAKRPLNGCACLLDAALRGKQQTVGRSLIAVTNLTASFSDGLLQQDSGEWAFENRLEGLPVMALRLPRVDPGMTFRARRRRDRHGAAQETEYQPH